MKFVSGRPIHGSQVEQSAFVLVISSVAIVVDRRKRMFVFILFVLMYQMNVVIMMIAIAKKSFEMFYWGSGVIARFI